MLVFEYKINKKKKGCGVKAMSIVENPAIETNFLTLSKEEIPEVHLKINAEQHIITGPAMIPDIKIYRTAESLGLDSDGYIYFTKETIKKASEMFLEQEIMNNATLEHEEKVSDLKLVESWIVLNSDKDKSAELGFNVPVGTWMVSYKVNNAELWERIKSGEFKGFSIEADNLDRVQVMAAQEKIVVSDQLASLFIGHLRKVGQTMEQLNAEGWELMPDDAVKLALESDPNAPSELDRKKYLVRFYYELKPENQAAGEKRIIETSREFCRNVFDANLWYRKEDIEAIPSSENPDFPSYDIFAYQGSYGCRHTWKKAYFSKSMKFGSDEPTDDEISQLIINKLADHIVKIK